MIEGEVTLSGLGLSELAMCWSTSEPRALHATSWGTVFWDSLSEFYAMDLGLDFGCCNMQRPLLTCERKARPKQVL